MLDDPAVDRGFEALWDASNASENLAQRSEQFGWLVKTATGYKVVTTGVSGTFCGIDATINWPAEGPGAVVGFVHTHPYSVGEMILTCDASGNLEGATPYKGTASNPDRAMSIQLGDALGRTPLPGIILDADGIRWFAGRDSTKTGERPRCGY